MLSYDRLKARPRELLAATGLTVEEFERLLPAFERAYAQKYPPERTLAGTVRQRQAGGGAKGQLRGWANKLLFNAHSAKVVYLSATVAGKTHDKKAADEAQIVYPHGATLAKDTGFQGYEPPGVLTAQPKKSRGGRN